MKDKEIKTSGKAQEFSTGAHRDTQENKPRYELIPVIALERLALHYAKGADLYGEDDWKQGMPLKRLLGSALRHLIACLDGMEDEDHGAAALWNICGFMYTKDAIERGFLPKRLDNLPLLESPATKDKGYLERYRELTSDEISEKMNIENNKEINHTSLPLNTYIELGVVAKSVTYPNIGRYSPIVLVELEYYNTRFSLRMDLDKQVFIDPSPIIKEIDPHGIKSFAINLAKKLREFVNINKELTFSEIAEEMEADLDKGCEESDSNSVAGTPIPLSPDYHPSHDSEIENYEELKSDTDPEPPYEEYYEGLNGKPCYKGGCDLDKMSSKSKEELKEYFKNRDDSELAKAIEDFIKGKPATQEEMARRPGVRLKGK